MRETDTGTDPLSRESISAHYRNPEMGYLLETLIAFSPRPYPSELIDLLGATMWRHADLNVPVIAEYARTAEFSYGQRELLSRWATGQKPNSYEDYAVAMERRLTLFRALWPKPTVDDIQSAMATFASVWEYAPQCKALFDIKYHYGDSSVPGPVVDWLFASIRDSKTPDLRYVGATMILNGETEFSDRERQILELIGQGRPESQLHGLLLDQYDVDAMQSFITLHARNKELPTEFRDTAIRRFGLMAAPGLQLSAKAEAVLRDAVLLDTDIYLGTAETTLGQWGIEPPLSARQKQENRNQLKGNIAGIVTLVFTVVVPIVFIAGLIVIPAAASLSRAPILSSTAAVIAWILYGGLLLLLWAYAVFGSYGIHGSGAPPEKHPGIMMPFHLASLIEIVIVVLCIRARRRNRDVSNQHAVAASAE